jgi:hypothetical protein
MYTGIRLLAVPEDRYDATARPADLPALATSRVDLREGEGPFEFAGLPPGAYRLVADSYEWMLHGPVRFTADSKDIEAVAVRAFGLSLRVEDAARGVLLGRFRVDVHFDERTTLTWEGRAGRLWTRVAHPMPLDWCSRASSTNAGSLRAATWCTPRVPRAGPSRKSR